jgi:hypothetical protein
MEFCTELFEPKEGIIILRSPHESFTSFVVRWQEQFWGVVTAI